MAHMLCLTMEFLSNVSRFAFLSFFRDVRGLSGLGRPRPSSPLLYICLPLSKVCKGKYSEEKWAKKTHWEGGNVLKVLQNACQKFVPPGEG